MGEAGLNATAEAVGVCPFCDGRGFLKWRFELLCCKTCRLVLDRAIWRPGVNAQMEEAFFGEGYQAARSVWVRLFETLNNRRTMRRLRRYAASPGSFLEIGVGSGSLLVYAESRGFVPLGCDLSQTICGVVERATGIEMHCGPLETLPNERKFDAIVMNHVLEHSPEPKAFLASALAHLKSNGVLHLAVPNVAAWEARLPGWNSYEPYHLLYFTPETLRAIVEKAGFEVLNVRTHESFSGWFLAILRTLLMRPYTKQVPETGKARPARRTSFLEHAYRLSMVVWGLITFPLRCVQQALGRGDEIVLLGRIRASDR